MDLKKMTKKELCDLRNKLTEEISLRELHTKSDIGLFTQIDDIFKPDLISYGLDSDKCGHHIDTIQRSIYKICDYTLKNYHVKNKTISVGNGYILDRFEDYKNMAGEIIEIIKKYRNMANQEGEDSK